MKVVILYHQLPTINKKLLKILKQLMLPYLKKIIYIATMRGAALDSPRLFFSEQELIKMQNDSATLGTFDIPEKSKKEQLKKFDNLNAIDVINKQRVAIGMEPLTSDSLELFDGLPTESKFLLNYSATSMTSARAWGTC